MRGQGSIARQLRRRYKITQSSQFLNLRGSCVVFLSVATKAPGNTLNAHVTEEVLTRRSSNVKGEQKPNLHPRSFDLREKVRE